MNLTRQIVRRGLGVFPTTNFRSMSAQAGPLVDLTFDNDDIAILTMQRPPVNSLNLDLLQELSKSLDDVAKSKPKGMILTSILPTVFSAGLDIMEMYKPDFKRADTFWSTLQEVWIKLYGSEVITAAAINGHAPAGGCLLSIACEYRAMVQGKFVIGLNETSVGIVPPTWVIENMAQLINIRNAEFALTSSKMFTVDEAMQVGLINDVASDKADALNKCKQFINKFDNIPSFARAATKKTIREGSLKRLLEKRRQDVDIFISFLKSPETQQALEMQLKMLKTKKDLSK